MKSLDMLLRCWGKRFHVLTAECCFKQCVRISREVDSRHNSEGLNEVIMSLQMLMTLIVDKFKDYRHVSKAFGSKQVARK